MTPSPDQLAALAVRLEAAKPSQLCITTGFDGFVDEMISVVGERRSLESFTPVPDIATFGQLVSAAAGHSSLREIVVNAVHPGGCAVNLADGLSSLGVVVDCFATLGEPTHPAFAEIAAKCRSFHSWGREPGRTLAFEFHDGKLMFSAVRQLAEFTPDAVRGYLADGAYQRACQEAAVIAFTDWSLYPHMTRVWRLLIKEVFPEVSQRPHIFIDLVDPASRSATDILEMTSVLPEFEEHGPLTLGLNGNEANILCRLHGLPMADAHPSADVAILQARTLREKLEISRVVIHRHRNAVSDTEAGSFLCEGPYCARPRKSTGAGDRFNAGFCLGLALGLSEEDSLALGCASSGFFVRHAVSASHRDLCRFLRSWAAGTLD